MELPVDTHRRHLIAMRAWLQGAGWHRALDALDFAEARHDGKRKDGVTPEFEHQIAIANYLRTLAQRLSYPESTFVAVFLHDIREDRDLAPQAIAHVANSTEQDAVERLTKVYRGARKPTSLYYAEIASCPIASVVKAADRVQNFDSMVGVFTPEKQVDYVVEAETYLIPAIKEARRRFSFQEPVYENAKLVLYSQMRLIRAMHPDLVVAPPAFSPAPAFGSD